MEDLQNMENFCLKCDVPKEFESGENSLEDSRKFCQYCRLHKKNKGIYKFDIVMSLWYAKEKFKGKGKTATYQKKYGTAVKSLKNQGKTQGEIAKTLGISRNSVIKILKNLEKEN